MEKLEMRSDNLSIYSQYVFKTLLPDGNLTRHQVKIKQSKLNGWSWIYVAGYHILYLIVYFSPVLLTNDVK